MYTELPRLIDKYSRQQFRQLVSEYLDLATADSVYDQFCLRRVNEIEVVSGVDVWELHLKNQLRLISEQYKQYLRVETTQIDPLVTQYMERQVLTTRKGTQTTTLNHSNARTDNLSISSTGSSTPGITETRRTVGQSTSGGTDNTDSGQTLDRTSTETRDTTRTDALQDKTTYNTTNTATNDSRTMNAQLPQSISYGSTGTSGRDSGLPGSLDWSVATAQQENDSTQTTENTGTDTVDHTGTSKDTGTVTTKETGSPTGYDRNTYQGTTDSDVTETVSRTGRDSETRTDSHTGTQTMQTTGTDTVGTDQDDNVKERMTGRTGSPQELLDAARQYILKTNAFEWLCARLNENFVWMGGYY